MEWDEKKAKSNAKKHKKQNVGITFEEAAEVFQDPNSIEFFDEEHSSSEELRYGCIGMSKRYLVLTVFFTDRSGNIRIISARPANRKEREKYYDELRRNNC
ncbi:MAG: BrnT family toxin [Bacteroides sp.]|nr:BrnT family toxin [Prevotella sp.]MCM1407693.1 BrnT family toxin [Treponema brennaborense]MCM1469157.1 BrnT family toxin [Bacteroides sp.]